MAIIPKGQEPANVKKRIDTLFPKLDGAYPDKVIAGLQRDHKKWDETAREISKQLGYENKNDFLTAYGYTIEKNVGGRPSGDHMAIIEELKKRYPNGSPFQRVPDLAEANPDLAPKFKNLSNKANELFGMPFAKYLISEGILADHFASKDLSSENDIPQIREVIIPEGTKTIKACECTNYKKLEKVVLPKTLVTIENKAFFGCEALEEIILPETIRIIEQSAFANCTSLKRIVIPRHTLRIGEKAFSNCSQLQEVVTPGRFITVFDKCKLTSLKKIFYYDISIVNDYIFERSDVQYIRTNVPNKYSESMNILNFLEFKPENSNKQLETIQNINDQDDVFAAFKGLKEDIDEVEHFLEILKIKHYTNLNHKKIEVTKGIWKISDIHLRYDELKRILHLLPSLKIVMRAHFTSVLQYCYDYFSESGDGFFSLESFVGIVPREDEAPWTASLPLEHNFHGYHHDRTKIFYEFPYKSEWERKNYVIEENNLYDKNVDFENRERTELI